MLYASRGRVGAESAMVRWDEHSTCTGYVSEPPVYMCAAKCVPHRDKCPSDGYAAILYGTLKISTEKENVCPENVWPWERRDVD